MPEAAALRQALAAFLGDDRFRKFVQQLCRRGRLRYWHEQEWGRFAAAHPEFAVSPEELAVALRICELHHLELQPDVVDVRRGCVDYADWYIQIRNRLFPHAASEPLSTEGASFEGNPAKVWYCPACRQAEAEWQARRSRPRAAADSPNTSRATIVVAVDHPDEVKAVSAWFGRWGDRLTAISDDYGCGCCVNIWNVEGPEEALRELPEVVVSGLPSGGKHAEQGAAVDRAG